MKKIKGIIVSFIALALIFVFAACSQNATAQTESNTESDMLTIEQIQNNPRSFLGEITLTGVVGSVDAREFMLHNEDNTFEVSVDYRGSQAFPQVGDEVIIEGELIENRPCCGGGFTIITTKFELAE